MEIILDDKYVIQSDQYNFTLMERKFSKEDSKVPGTESRVALAYCSRLGDALRFYTKKALGTTEAKDFKEILTALERLEKVVTATGKEFLQKFEPPTAKSTGNAKGEL